MGVVIKILVGLLFIALAFTGIFLFLGDLTSTYDISIDSKYLDTYGRINQTTEEMQNLSLQFQDSIESEGSSNPILGFVDQLFNTGWTTVKSVGSSVGIASSMIDATTEVPGVDSNSWFTNGLKTAIAIIVFVTLIGIAMRRDL